jgi:WD domain, G-beta repeat
VSGGDDGVARYWGAGQGGPALLEIATRLPITALQISSDGRMLYTGSVDNNIRVWDLRMIRGTGKESETTTTNTIPIPISTWKGHTDTIVGMRFSNDQSQQENKQ